MRNKELTARELQSRGGRARAQKLTPEERSAIARKGGLAIAGKPRKKKGKEEK
jgi:general stress protein YciG